MSRSRTEPPCVTRSEGARHERSHSRSEAKILARPGTVSAALARLCRAEDRRPGACRILRPALHGVPVMARERLYLFDTTLRDGQQTPGIDFSLDDKLVVMNMLDQLGIDY